MSIITVYEKIVLEEKEALLVYVDWLNAPTEPYPDSPSKNNSNDHQ